MQSTLRDQARDIYIHLLPTECLRQGCSAGAAIFLALLKLLLGCRIKPNVVVTGMISLSGYMVAVGGIETKVEDAVKYGADIVVIPTANRQDIAKSSLSPETKAKIRYAVSVVDLLAMTVEGKRG